MDALSAKHRQECKQLQADIQALKHSVAKGDKKRQKEVQQQIQRLQCELKAKQEKEIREATLGLETNTDHQTECMHLLTLSDEKANDTVVEESNTSNKLSKTQRKREKKLQQEKERQLRIAKEEAENVNSFRNLEAEKLNAILSDRGLAVFDIPSDGDCMYKAIEHQLSLQNIDIRVPELREKCAEVMLQRKQEFLPFLTSRETGDLMSDTEYEKYCDDIANTKAWGGHVELKALCSFLNRPIEVCQANGPSVIVGDEFKCSPLILSYHRHAYHLGEHYNSVIKYDKHLEKESTQNV